MHLLLSSSLLFLCISLALEGFSSRETWSSAGNGEAVRRCGVASSLACWELWAMSQVLAPCPPATPGTGTNCAAGCCVCLGGWFSFVLKFHEALITFTHHFPAKASLPLTLKKRIYKQNSEKWMQLSWTSLLIRTIMALWVMHVPSESLALACLWWRRRNEDQLSIGNQQTRSTWHWLLVTFVTTRNLREKNLMSNKVCYENR